MFEFGGIQIPAFQEALHHGRQRAVEGVFECVKQFAVLRLPAGHGGMINGQLPFLFRLEHALGDHAVHQGADGRIGPTGRFEQFFLDGGRGAGFGFPDGLDDGPFSLGKLDGGFGYAPTISTSVDNVKLILYNCKYERSRDGREVGEGCGEMALTDKGISIFIATDGTRNKHGWGFTRKDFFYPSLRDGATHDDLSVLIFSQATSLAPP